MRPHARSARCVVVVVVVVVSESVSVVDPSNSDADAADAGRARPKVLHYEKLDVYQVSIQFVAMAVALSGQLPKGYAPLADQLRRAAWSIPLNIAEGVGKPSPSDQARFHAIARGSAMECGAILDVARVLQVSSPQELMSAKQLIVRIVEMLTKLSR
jgi:four helix bundle protein